MSEFQDVGLVNVHSEELCSGMVCVIHNQTDHHMRDWKWTWRSDRGIFERLCEHGIGHPDPDQFPYWESIDEMWQTVHGCDSCCNERAYKGMIR